MEVTGTMTIKLDNNTTIQVSMEEAKRLYEALKPFFDKTTYQYIPYAPYNPVDKGRWDEPIITYRDNSRLLADTTWVT